jgi:hypothetical protein
LESSSLSKGEASEIPLTPTILNEAPRKSALFFVTEIEFGSAAEWAQSTPHTPRLQSEFMLSEVLSQSKDEVEVQKLFVLISFFICRHSKKSISSHYNFYEFL